MHTTIGLFAVLGAVLASADAAAGEQLARRDILEGRVSLLLPTSFERMPDERLRAKYPSAHRPAFVFTDATGAVKVAARHSGLAITPQELVQVQRDIEHSVQTQAPATVWLQSEALSKDGHSYLLLAYQSPGVDADVQNIMYVASVDGRLLTISFNCPVKGVEQWLHHGQEIIESIVVAE